MARWLIQLKGDRSDLEEFPYWFPNGDIFAIEENENVFIVGAAFDKYVEASQVLEVATEALDNFSAIVQLLWPALNRPSIEKILYEDDTGNRKGYVFASAHFVARTKFRAMATVNGVFEANTGPTQAQQLLSASHASRNLHLAVLLWADPTRTWPRLYRIMEELEQHLKMSLNKAGFCTASRRKIFTHSANAAEVASKDSRHALGKFSPPQNPMTLNDASNFIGEMLQAALRSVSV